MELVKNISDIFASVVDATRPNGILVDFAPTSNPTQYVVTNDIHFRNEMFCPQKDFYIDFYKITGEIIYENSKIVSVDLANKQFTVELSSTYDTEPYTWKCQAPYYENGHILEVANTLSEKSKGKTLKFKKYPLIVLVEDVNRENTINIDVLSEIKPILFFCALTEPTYTAEQRKNATFIPMLYPLLNSFFEELHYSRFFKTYSPNSIKSTVIDRYYWGKNAEFANKANIFNDWLDAIEVTNLTLEVERNHNIEKNLLQTI